MRAARFLLWCVLLLGVSAALAGEVPAAADLPKSFHASIGGHFGGGYVVDLRDGVLIYGTHRGDERILRRKTIKPTTAQWRSFREALDELRVWKWRANYPSKDVADGTQWSLEIAYADHVLKTQGDNNYPDAHGKPNGHDKPTEEFNRYLAAIEKLAGGRQFR